MAIYTIGHSIRSLDEFAALLKAHEIGRLADVRSIPRSQRHPHFAAEALAVSLPQADVIYRHFPDLGGHRKPRPDSRNTAWRLQAFRGYADHMETPAFDRAIDDLVAWAEDEDAGRPRVAVMCAEAVWWRCHRQLIADALVARDVEVRHITGPTPAAAHQLTEFARVVGRRVTYPGLV
jgi:uncharacterized protein (DUF488 family)